MGRGVSTAVIGLAAVGVVAAVGYGVLTGDGPLGTVADTCTATVDGHTVELEVEQAENAALITAISVRRGLPARAASIALATAYQESDLYNLDYGDRDSVGLFQQRPSMGWGSVDEILDPAYATNAFYDGLVEVDGYEALEITEAAQEVQRSGFPGAYADHEADARVLASALTGNSRGAFVCDIDDDSVPTDPELVASGLTARAETVRQEAEGVFGDLSLGGFAPGGVSDGHMEGSAHYDGRAVDIFVRPVSPANKTRGWAIAHYLVAQAERLGVQTVIFDDRIWKAGDDEGWRDYDPPSRNGDRQILEHRDHVHVDVFD
ncbi:hypothetical protein SAMN05192576_2038 [Nocardioides szechwanensis]|uniref:ARB-07466-like C-terminal domain-containing protein n=1 Tax=Nocardioides szechwanensis TaxID=1005944 RepID=A0A1H0AH62_9ACTN|nr:hypothetical protein [Nocardioides szechwanensis]SDN32942.1 hypothetical protein SAMN05192576_2038 [Nocardioides szechwanensis]